MITGSRKAVTPQPVAYLFHHFSGQTVNDSAFFSVHFQIIFHSGVLILRGLHSKIKIRPVKTCCQHLRRLQHQNINNIIPYFLSSRSSKRSHNRPFGKTGNEFHDFQIAGTEILPPLGYTMRLIYRHHGNIRILGKIQELLRNQPFRGHIYNRISPGSRIFQRLPVLSLCE